jgi:sarcosine oxidase subunit beta
VLQGQRATGLRLRGGRVTAVECDGETIECETVVNASGAWARRLGGALGLTLPVDGYRRQLVQFEPPGPLATPVPMVIDYVPGVGGGISTSGTTRQPDHLGLTGRCTEGGTPQGPDAFRRRSTGLRGRVAEALAARYRGAADFRVTGGWAGLYPLTPDTRPIVGPTPGVDGLYQALGGGGVGVQISPAVGAMVADLITTGETRVVDDPYRLVLRRRARPHPESDRAGGLRGRGAARVLPQQDCGIGPCWRPATRQPLREEGVCCTFWVRRSSASSSARSPS